MLVVYLVVGFVALIALTVLSMKLQQKRLDTREAPLRREFDAVVASQGVYAARAQCEHQSVEYGKLSYPSGVSFYQARCRFCRETRTDEQAVAADVVRSQFMNEVLKTWKWKGLKREKPL
jgi:hypothetical protein